MIMRIRFFTGHERQDVHPGVYHRYQSVRYAWTAENIIMCDLHSESDHGRSEVFRNLGKKLGVVVVRDSLHDGASTLRGITRL